MADRRRHVALAVAVASLISRDVNGWQFWRVDGTPLARLRDES